MPSAVGEVKSSIMTKDIASPQIVPSMTAEQFFNITGRGAHKEKRDERNGYYLLEKCTTVGFHTLPQAVK